MGKEQRQQLQEQAVQLSLKHKDLILEWATGVGKTLALLNCIAASQSKKKWLIVVPEVPLIENFMEDAYKHGYRDLVNEKVEQVICYASLHKFAGRSVNLGMDEAHHISEKRLEVVSSIRSDQRILLSATIPTDVRERINGLGSWHVYRVEAAEAIDSGILPEPIINVITVHLDDREACYACKTGKGSFKCTAREYYKRLDSSVLYWEKEYMKGQKVWQQRKFLQAALERKRFMATIKTEAAHRLIDSIRDSKRRFVCFSGSVEQAKELGGKLSVHSRNSKDKNLQIIEEFNEGKTSELFANQMLREGMNLEDTEVGIIVQLDNQEKSTIQMLGRILRHETPELFIFIAKDTKDEDYLRKAIKAVNITNINFL